MFGFKVKEGFKADEGSQHAPAIPDNIMDSKK
jgi:hypothetical protein